MDNVVIQSRTLQGSVVTQTMLGGLAVHTLVADFLYCRPMSAQGYEKCLTVDEVIAILKMMTFLLDHKVLS